MCYIDTIVTCRHNVDHYVDTIVTCRHNVDHYVDTIVTCRHNVDHYRVLYYWVFSTCRT